jgi:hypothetical protein
LADDPTAVHAAGDVHDTPLNWLAATIAVRVGCTDHLERCQRSASAICSALVLVKPPTRVQAAFDVQDTPLSALSVEPTGGGGRSGDHREPLQRSATDTLWWALLA